MKYFFSNILVGFLKLISRLPMGFLYLISNFLYIVIYRLASYRKDVVRKNLQLSFPEKLEAELLKIEKAYYRYLCDLILETVKGFTARKMFLSKRIQYIRSEILDELHHAGQSAIVVMGHCGNWEWICRSAAFKMKNRVVVAYKPLSDKAFDKLIAGARTKYGVRQVPMSQVGRFILQEKQPFLLILLSDQSPSDNNGVYWTKFLNQDTAVLNGAEKLSKRFNMPLLFNDVKRLRRGYYTCETKLLLNVDQNLPEGRISEIHTHALEEKIKEQPETWLWSHRRWKLKKP